MTPPLQIGVLGGAFDPPHLAHVALANAALAELALDRLLIIPTGMAWHKEHGLSDARHRLAMARLAFGGLPKAEVDEREVRRAGPTYTLDTLRELQAENPGAQIHLILGADQVQALMRWHQWEAVLQSAIITVAVRGVERAENDSLTANNAPSGHAVIDALPAALRAVGRFEPLHMPALAVSATHIRQRVAAGLGIANLVTEPVARYIAQNHLYIAH